MAIDVNTAPVSPGEAPTAETAGFWLNRLSRALHDTKRQSRLAALDAWYRGDPPLPEGATAARSAFRAFQRHARSNFAALIVEAPRARMRPRGIRTSADGDDTGDEAAWRLWRRSRINLAAPDVHRLMLRFGIAYVLIGEPVGGYPVVTAEDPRMVVTEDDPVQSWQPLAGLKMFRDDVAGRDLAYLYRPGRLDVAYVETRGRRSTATRFSPQAWTFDDALSRDLPRADLMPIVPFRNLDGAAEFEPHVDLLQRINHMILQRMMIATLQAFRQRALKGAPQRDDKGNKIDWNDILSSDPAAIWALPGSVDLWESGQIDLTPILSAVAADVKHLAAVTQTPMHMLDPSGQNQSAEGAALSREGLVFKVEDHIERVNPCWSQVLSTAFLWQGDEQRADLDYLELIWSPADRASLMEKAAAAAQAKAAGVPWRTVMTDVMGYDPDHVDRMEAERDDDLLFAQRLAAVQLAAQSAAQAQQPSSAELVAAGAGQPSPQQGQQQPSGATAGAAG